MNFPDQVVFAATGQSPFSALRCASRLTARAVSRDAQWSAGQRQTDDHLARLITTLAVAWALALFCSPGFGATPVFPVPPEIQGAAAPPLGTQPMTRETLTPMYRVELGDHFRPELVEPLYQAHILAEKYFAAQSIAERKTLTKQIEATGVDPSLLGRIIRLRMNWGAVSPGIYYVNQGRGPLVVRYFLGVPRGYDRAKSTPLVIKLPTPDEYLRQPPADVQSVVNLYAGWIVEELTKHPDAAVLMPLMNLDTLYGPSTTGMNSVIHALQHAADRVNIDPARVYLTGHSLAAEAVWNLALHYPTYFASFESLAGSATTDFERVRLTGLSNILPVVWADSDDTVIKPDMSRSLVRALKGLKIDADYQETKGIGHTPTDAVLEERYKHMRSRVRPLYPTDVSLQSTRIETTFNRNDWIQLWQALSPGKEHRVLLRQGGFIALNETSDRLAAKREGNHIELTVDNLESLRLYFNDQMIDFSQPVSITINKKQKFEGYVKPSIDDMLKDQVFLGRGWRYFSAQIDIDLTAGPVSRPTTGPTTRTGKITVGPG